MKRHSRRRKALFSITLVVLMVVMVEGGAHLLYALLNRQLFPFQLFDEAIDRSASSPESTVEGIPSEAGELNWDDSVIEVLHPYLGFVRDPEKSRNTSILGFPQEDDDPFLRESGDALSVAVFGGSFAAGTSIAGESIMQSTLGEYGIDAHILTLALGGYKQPQQLLLLAYLLSHGAEIDVVVNIDGFNEVALPQAENLPKGVNPFYPRSWYNRTVGLSDQGTLRAMGRILVVQDDRRRWARLFLRLPKFSITRNLVWAAYDRRLERRIADMNEQLRLLEPHSGRGYLTTGPDLGAVEGIELYEQIADHWESCSILMKALCDSHEITYIHILQPNQYFQAGRALTEEERKNAFREDHIYRPGVVKGYPRLLAAADDLLDRGVDFHDLTMIYAGIEDPIYTDDCCHPSWDGYGIIAEYIAHAISEAIGSRKAEKSAATDGP